MNYKNLFFIALTCPMAHEGCKWPEFETPHKLTRANHEERFLLSTNRHQKNEEA